MAEEDPKKVNKWDSPTPEDLFGRAPFVDTIVKTIQSSKEGFNLGISARWGEGKSSILEQLKPKLDALNYKVLKFEPWKYTQDKISIKRKFIIDIYSQLGKNYSEAELYGSSERETPLEDQEYWDLFIKRLWLFGQFSMVAAVLFLIALLVLKKIFGIDINVTQSFINNLYIPVLAGMIPLLSKLMEVTVKQTIPKIESAEQFEKLFNTAISEIMESEEPPERIIIFVDDLDRCSHSEVEQILTALFTFFNNKYCTYVITADHTVIQRYISSFLQLEDEVDENGNVDVKKTNEMRHKEATEYLKKIFQINFILPKIPSDLLEDWVKKLIGESPIIAFKNSYGKDYLITMILNNFQGNPRKIKHFVRTLEFQLEAVTAKIARLADPDSTEGKNLAKVKDSPELLAKILVIQDRFPDFYESITETPKLLQRHEEGEVAENKELQNLLAQEPKFFNSATRSGEYKTIDPYYFLFFSGATGFVETKAVDPSEIKTLARAANFDGLTKIISGLTDAPRNEQVEQIKREFDASGVPAPEKLNVVRSLIHVIGLIEEPTMRNQKLNDIFDSKKKFTTELAALQSVDFAKLITFADVGIVSKLLSEEPFTSFAMQNQILSAFVEKQKDVEKGEKTDQFIQAIAEGIKRNDTNSMAYLSLSKKLTPESFADSDVIQEAYLDAYKKAGDPFKRESFDAILARKDKFSSARNKEFEDAVLAVVEQGPIGVAVTMMGNIPDKINGSNFDMAKIIKAVRERIAGLPSGELDQWVNMMTHPSIMKELGEENVEFALLELLELIDDPDAAKRAVVRQRLPQIFSFSKKKSTVLKRVMKSLIAGPLSESTPTLATVQGMSDFWNAESDLKAEFVKQLRSAKTKDKDIKELLVKAADELDPPPPPKQEEKKDAEG